MSFMIIYVLMPILFLLQILIIKRRKRAQLLIPLLVIFINVFVGMGNLTTIIWGFTVILFIPSIFDLIKNKGY